MSIPKPVMIDGEEINLKGRKHRPSPKIQPPLMPLIDVMFTLMLFFLIAARVRGAEGMIPANLPNLGGPDKVSRGIVEKIFIGLQPSGAANEGVTISLGTSSVADATQLASKLASAKQLYGDEAVVIIKPHPQVRWTHVVNIFNQAVSCHFKEIGFAPSSGG
jgi:biopolymer transport protein ExbD